MILILAYRGDLYPGGILEAMSKVVLRSQSAKLTDVHLIRADVRYGTVSILMSANEKLRVREKGPADTPKDETVRLSNKDGVVTISDRTATLGEPLGRDVEIHIPQDYRGGIEIRNHKGGFQCGDPLRISSLQLDFPDGDIRLSAPLECGELLIRGGSGEIRIDCLRPGKSAQVISDEGNIRLTLDKDYAYALDARSKTGQVRFGGAKAGEKGRSLIRTNGPEPRAQVFLQSDSGKIELFQK